MLEPDLKEGAGGLRDVQSLEWAGWTFGAPGGGAALLERGYLSPDDRARVLSGRERLLEARVALQRVTGGRADRLALQEQDAVAATLGLDTAGTLVRDLASAAREVAWIARDVWMRVRESLGGPSGRVAHRDQTLAEHVVFHNLFDHVERAVPGLKTLAEVHSLATLLDALLKRIYEADRLQQAARTPLSWHARAHDPVALSSRDHGPQRETPAPAHAEE